jgi:hypothetical protein
MANNVTEKQRRENKEYFLKRFNEIIDGEVLNEYVNRDSKIIFRCNTCGQIHTKIAHNLMIRPYCPSCHAFEKKKKSFENMIKKVEEKGLYEVLEKECPKDYDYYTTKILVRCKKCDAVYSKRFKLINEDKGCIQCRCQSEPEKRIYDYLKVNNIDFIKEYMPEGLIYKQQLRFDFYLVKYNLIIEYDGEYHFNKRRFGDEEFEIQQIRDKKKAKYCEDNNIPLLRISYEYSNDIENILDKELKNYIK